MEGIKYLNLIEISPVVIEIQGIQNVDLVAPVNNRLACHTSFLAADTRLSGMCPQWLVVVGTSCSHHLDKITTTINSLTGTKMSV